MKEFVLSPASFIGSIKGQKKVLFAAFLIPFALVMAVFFVLPRSYLSEAVIHIGVSYFQNPLIGDLMSQMHDPGELRSERERIIKSSLGVQFANKMGEKYNLFKSASNSPDRATEVQSFLKSLEIVSLSSTQFSIKYKARNPATADGIVRAAIDAVREYMYVHRVQMLEDFFSVLQDELSGGGTGGHVVLMNSEGAARPHSGSDRSEIEAQIKVLESRLSDLQSTYNERHPSVLAVKADLNELRQLENGGDYSAKSHARRKFLRSEPVAQKGSASSLVRDDLTKQEHLVNISLEMEKKDPSMSAYVSLVKEPVFPQKPMSPKLHVFAIIAFVSGLMSALAAVAIADYWRKVPMVPEVLAKQLKLDLFGTMALPE